MRRIVLFGYRGTGKTAIGTILARGLNVPFLDTDTLIEQESGRTIPDIFREDGEERFRALERDVIATLPARDIVIGTGGGVVMDPVNMEHLRAASVCVLLTSDLATIGRRLARAPRPPLTNLPQNEEIAQVITRRRRQYAASADFCVDTSRTSTKEAADRILSLLEKGVVPAPERAAAFRWFAAGPSRHLNMHGSKPCLPARTGTCRHGSSVSPASPAATAKAPCSSTGSSNGTISTTIIPVENPSIRTIMQVARDIDAKGLSVTIPFKKDVMACLDEIDDAAQQIGAVNTVVFACGSAHGCNTDWLGIQKPLTGDKGARAVLLGAGGVAAAAAYALTDLDMEVTILNRTPQKAQELAEHSGCRWKSWDAFSGINPDLVVNATSIGMQPDTGSPLRDDQLKKEMTVFDLVYTPPVTP